MVHSAWEDSSAKWHLFLLLHLLHPNVIHVLRISSSGTVAYLTIAFVCFLSIEIIKCNSEPTSIYVEQCFSTGVL